MVVSELLNHKLVLNTETSWKAKHPKRNEVIWQSLVFCITRPFIQKLHKSG